MGDGVSRRDRNASIPFKINISIVEGTDGPNACQYGAKLFKYGALSVALETLVFQISPGPHIKKHHIYLDFTGPSQEASCNQRTDDQ